MSGPGDVDEPRELSEEERGWLVARVRLEPDDEKVEPEPDDEGAA